MPRPDPPSLAAKEINMAAQDSAMTGWSKAAPAPLRAVIQHPKCPDYDPFASIGMQQPALVDHCHGVTHHPPPLRPCPPPPVVHSPLPTPNVFPDFEPLFFVALLPPLLPLLPSSPLSLLLLSLPPPPPAIDDPLGGLLLHCCLPSAFANACRHATDDTLVASRICHQLSSTTAATATTPATTEAAASQL